MDEHRPTHRPPRDLHIRDLESHPDDKRKIREVDEIRVLLSRKGKTGIGLARAAIAREVV